MVKNYKFVPYLVTAFIVTAEVAISFNSVLLPNLKAEFFISNQLAQMTTAGGLFALGFAGMIYGGLSDALGRRPVFLFSTLLFSITSLICAIAPNVETLLIARFFQGLGSGAGWVVGNACLKDIFEGKKYITVMNYVHAIAGIVPAVAPIIGAYIATQAGWRNCFYGLFGFSFLASIVMYFFQPETITTKRKIYIKQVIRDYRLIFHERQFVVYCAIKVLAVMMILCEISNIPLIYIDYLDVNPLDYGFYVLPVFVLYILATLVGSKLIKFFSINIILKTGLVFIMLSNLLTLGLNWTWHLTAMKLQILRSLSYIGWGFIFGNATAKIVSVVPGKSGMASALMIAFEMLFSSVGIYLLGFFFNQTIIPLSIFIILVTIIAIVILSRYERQLL